MFCILPKLQYLCTLEHSRWSDSFLNFFKVTTKKQVHRKTAVSSHHIVIWMWALAVSICVQGVVVTPEEEMFLPLLARILFLSLDIYYILNNYRI